jgi:hypothetical protein
MLTAELINKYIVPANVIETQIKKRYQTADIMQLVLAFDKTAYRNTATLAQHIQYNGVEDLCKQIWDFLKTQIQYKEDIPGSQLVKTPSALWRAKVGDCKSFAIFTASILKNLSIPYSYRFVSFSDSQTPTHVYVVAHNKGKDIIIDAVWKYFNSEKKYSFKHDFLMEGLVAVSGVGSPLVKTKAKTAKAVKSVTTTPYIVETPAMQKINNRPKHEYKPGMLRIFSPNHKDIDLAVIKQRFEIERGIVANKRGVSGIGKVEHYDRSLAVINSYINATERSDYAKMNAIIGSLPENSRERNYLTDHFQHKVDIDDTVHVDGIGNIFKKAAAAVKTVAKKAGAVTKTVAKAVAKGTVAVVKTAAKVTVKAVQAVESVVTRPILEIALPSASPYFMYEFANTKDLGTKAQKKQLKAHNLLKAISNVTGVKLTTLQGICRNGIMKRYGKSPENVIAEWKKNASSKIKGIGAVDPSVISAILTSLNSLIDMVKKLFKKGEKVEPVATEDIPGADDFGDSVQPRDGETPAATSERDYTASSTPADTTDPNAVSNKNTGGLCGGGGARQ